MDSNNSKSLQKSCVSEPKSKTSTFSIGEVAKMVGTKVRTIRYYDEIGFIKPSTHTEGGHRLYTSEDIWRLHLTLTLRYLDFSIDEISQLFSGELLVDKAIDWQIESLATQVSALTNSITILRKAKQQPEEHLRHLHDLVHETALNVEQRKHFIAKKIKNSNMFNKIPSIWMNSVLYFFNKYIVHQAKLTAQQTAAWHELQELINDPQFMKELNNIDFFFFHTDYELRYDPTTWIKKLEYIHNRLNEALDQKRSADSPYVQAIVEEMMMLYANTEQTIDKEGFLRSFAAYAQKIRTPLLERCNTLCCIISPQFNLLAKGNFVLFQSLQHKLKKLSDG
ncbi:MerR family transcriptional regulator [Virgibacillus sp. Bac330]|uniref:MerR family transcriptional regulator n=1 Tax=Virgibacillus sp. Bac330 TaxID=2419841 RepID=UPI000EF4A43C|nr:MerR family transcriptional regulator [Virgibacillus sp. Bac330]